ncbi:hypothetical protein LOK49_LG14G00337 [Camellia lanceoleosa]|uniref:Uncharacterized protein n=1 Tax=Camellia lanceoleosa TaxID=1840588 RepID=A0ACC0FCP6_9ERIC|nr:hypothetical protein LOK49_LG14G00337 [Camellia lanceoleosa]
MAALLVSNPTLFSPFLGQKLSLSSDSKRSTVCSLHFRSPRCAVDTPYEGNVPKFPRTNVWDPYKRLGISTDASEEEIWDSRNFLLDQYARHERSAEAIEVAISLAACIYFLNDKTKSLARASIIGFGSLVVGWVCGSFLVPMIPSVVIHPTWTLELLTSLVAYVFLFLGCTFLK